MSASHSFDFESRKKAPATASSSFQTALLYMVAIFAVYQQYCIYQLQTEVASLQDHFAKMHSVDKSPNDWTQFPTTKSPPPQVPAYQVFANDTRSVGGNTAKGKSIYGGVGDEAHLGGFTDFDKMTVSHNLWNFMMGPMAVKSMIDIGCGRGISTSYFRERGARVLCVEGSHDAIKHSFLPASDIVQHDYSKGPWWPEETFDVAYSTEFVEHIGRQYHPNYFPTFKKAAFVMFTASAYGGYHHVEVQTNVWWLARMQANGFVYDKDLTEFIQDQVTKRHLSGSIVSGIKVFINPAVASLPKHRHLWGGHGCYHGVLGNEDGGEPCTGVDALPLEYESLLDCNRYYVNQHGGRNWTQEDWECVPNAKVFGKKVVIPTLRH